MSHTSSSEVKPVLNTLPPPTHTPFRHAQTHSHTHTRTHPRTPTHTHTRACMLISPLAQVSAESDLHWANSERFGWFYLHLLRSPGSSTSRLRKKKESPSRKPFQQSVSKWSVYIEKFCLFFSVKAFSCQFSWETIQVVSILAGVCFIFYFFSCVMSYFRRIFFVLLPPLAITLMCFCICLLVSNFSCLLDCVCCSCPLGLECLCGPFPGSNPRLPPHAAMSVSDLSCSVVYDCTWIFEVFLWPRKHKTT